MNRFAAFLEELRPQVEATLDGLLPPADAPPARLHEAMRYCLFAGGKRVRPALVVLAGETLGAPRARLLHPAAVVEMIHTFSLVHDDLPALDDDDLRRGKPTVHRQYDEALAVLVGDALLNLGLGVLSRHPADSSPEMRCKAVEIVTEAVGTSGMIGGQVADLESEAKWPDDPVDVLDAIHRRKTGALLVASLRLGGLVAGADRDTDRALGALGERIGLIFQIGDDILDVEATSAVLGKTAGKDVRAEKLTYPRVYGVDKSKEMLQRIRDEALETAGELPGDGELVGALVDYLSSRDH